MYKAPLLRRLLPWLYALVFLAIAPILILYTAGYTYNIKKHMVERNGVLIVDGLPKGAQIWLDGTDTGKTIPYTFQTLSPGWHVVHAQKAGYSSWEKQLNIIPEEVSFANQVRLWSIHQATLLLNAPITQIKTDPTDNWIATVSSSSSQTSVGRFSPDKPSGFIETALSNTTPSTPTPIRWNDNGTSFVLNAVEPIETSYWTNLNDKISTNQLPPGVYSWTDQNTLVGTDDHAMTRLDISTNRFSREPLPSDAVFQDQELLLQTTGTPPLLLLTKRSLQDKIYQLSGINWRPMNRFQQVIILKDRQQDHWMALDLNSPHPYAGDVWGDLPRWQPESGTNPPKALLLHGGEAWVWEPRHDPELIWRQAEPLVEGVWETGGGQVILADKTHVFSLELDNRDGRQTSNLASFDEINSITLFKKRLYIAGREGERQGVWERIIE